MLRKPIIFCFITAFLLCGSQAMAGGGQSYPNGSEAFMAGAVPPPGTYFLDYAYYYSADSMKDDNGDNIAAFDDVSVLANVFRLLWVSDKQILGGSYAAHAFLPVLDIDLKFKAPVGPESTNKYSDTSVPYVIVNPFILAWPQPGVRHGSRYLVQSQEYVFLPA